MKFSIFKSPNTVFDLTAKTCKSNDSYRKRNLPNNMKSSESKFKGKILKN